ncbi:MAG: hypothetical protein KatS3mg119_1985 [Rhodothalassiaceae bacterium]|nr:MAG: hypothetical protein KatS3mg119_1985 [Rhodothalassiaceae bacterium]
MDPTDRLVVRLTLVVKPQAVDALETAAARVREALAARGLAVTQPERPLATAGELLVAGGTVATLQPVVHGLLADLPVDYGLRPADLPACRLLISDMDSTLIAAECIDELARLAGVGDRVREVTERAMRGELDFAGALRERVALLAGLPEQALEEVATAHAPLRPGARTLFATLVEERVFTVIVSGGFTPIVSRIAEALGAVAAHANELEVEAGRLTGRVKGAILDGARKAELLASHARRLGIDMAATAALGDGANDLKMLAAAGMAVGVHPKPVVAQAAHGVVRHTDLKSVLLYLGIPPARWVIRD